jgi:hypothetical protein
MLLEQQRMFRCVQQTCLSYSKRVSLCCELIAPISQQESMWGKYELDAHVGVVAHTMN